MPAATGILYLSQNDVANLGLGMAEIIEAVEAAFIEKGLGRVEMPPKPGIHTRPDAFIHAMPAYVRSQRAAGMKWVSGYPENSSRGLPYISGLLILNDVDTGFPLAIMDATWITAMRTGAATAVAAKYLARTDSRSVAILGCGVQGRSNLCALAVVLPRLDRVFAYDIRDEAARSYCQDSGADPGLPCTTCSSPEEAVRQADVIVTAGPILRHPSPVIVPGWLREGSFVCTVDFDSYVTPAAFHAASIFFTDDVSQLAYYRKSGYFAGVPENPSDLGHIVARLAPGRRTASEITIGANLGLALEDIVTAQRIYQLALTKKAGTWLPL